MRSLPAGVSSPGGKPRSEAPGRKRPEPRFPSRADPSPSGETRTRFANVESALSGSPRLLKITIDIESITHNTGWTGVSRFSDHQELIFIGDRAGNQGSIGFVSSGGPRLNSGTLVVSGIVTLLYDHQTGSARFFEGEDIDAEPLASATRNPGLAINRLRIGNDSSGEITVEMRAPSATSTQLAEFTFFNNGTQVQPVAVSNPGGANPAAPHPRPRLAHRWRGGDEMARSQQGPADLRFRSARRDRLLRIHHRQRRARARSRALNPGRQPGR